MPIKAEWDNEDKTIIRHIYEGRWEWEDLYDVVDESRNMMDAVDHKVDFIADLADSNWMPPSPTAHFSQVKTLFDHPNAGKVIVISTSRFIDVFGQIFTRVFGKLADRLQFVRTHEEAYQVLSVRQD